MIGDVEAFALGIAGMPQRHDKLHDAEAQKARSADAAGLSEQIKMVAGVGFEPTTFRL